MIIFGNSKTFLFCKFLFFVGPDLERNWWVSIQCPSLIKSHFAVCPPWEWTWERMCVAGKKFHSKLQKNKAQQIFCLLGISRWLCEKDLARCENWVPGRLILADSKEELLHFPGRGPLYRRQPVLFSWFWGIVPCGVVGLDQRSQPLQALRAPLLSRFTLSLPCLWFSL